MKVLIDEDLPHELRHYLPNHDVYTVRYLRWDGLKNGALLRKAEAEDFDVFLTGDQNLTSQQKIKGRRFGVVTVTGQRLDVLLSYIDEIRTAISRSTHGSVQVVDCPDVLSR